MIKNNINRNTVLEINLSNIKYNIDYFRSFLKPSTQIMAVVKAFSYGNGDVEISKFLEKNGVNYLAVAFIDEGIRLREGGIKLPILVLQPEINYFYLLKKYSLEPVIYSHRTLLALINEVKKEDINIHLKLDTGMHRLGFVENEADWLIENLKQHYNLKIISIFSHLAASSETNFDHFTLEQISKFKLFSKQIIDNFDYKILLHILNSSGIERFSSAQMDIVRLGIGMYNVSAVNKHLKNVSTFKSIISQIKEVKKGDSVGYSRGFVANKNSKIAIIPVGYADGLNRKLSQMGGRIFVNGKYANMAGTICMDMCFADVTDIEVNEGDEVVFWGKEIPIEEVANQLGTIVYEILTSVNIRVKRTYIK